MGGGGFSGCDKRRIFASFVYQIERVCFLEVRKLPFPIKLIQAARKRSHPRPFHVGTAHCRSRIVPHMADFTLSRWVVSRLTFADKGAAIVRSRLFHDDSKPNRLQSNRFGLSRILLQRMHNALGSWISSRGTARGISPFTHAPYNSDRLLPTREMARRGDESYFPPRDSSKR
jgi:hypothetical protein